MRLLVPEAPLARLRGSRGACIRLPTQMARHTTAEPTWLFCPPTWFEAPTWLFAMVTPASTNSCRRGTSKLVAPTCLILPFFCGTRA